MKINAFTNLFLSGINTSLGYTYFMIIFFEDFLVGIITFSWVYVIDWYIVDPLEEKNMYTESNRAVLLRTWDTPSSTRSSEGSFEPGCQKYREWDLAPVPLSIFRSNSKFDENSERSSFEYTGPITTIFCTRHDSGTVVTCAKYRCDRSNIFETRAFWIFIEFRIRSKYA